MHRARTMYLNCMLSAKHIALLKNISITRITATASARPTVIWESTDRNLFTQAQSFGIYIISLTGRPPFAGVFTVTFPQSHAITEDCPPSRL